MSGTNDNKPRIRFPAKKDIVTCIMCEKPHERREGPAHRLRPLCWACDDSINRRRIGLKDTVDFHVKGF